MSAIGAGWLYLGWGAILFHTNYGLMQQSPFEIKERLLKALDKEYNVVDMGTVLEIVTILEKTPITKEALETTRLGRDINELRRKTKNESLAKRAKDLVRRWRDLILPQNATAPIAVADSSQQNGSSRNTAQARIPAAVPSNPISPAISLHSDKSSVSPASTRVEAVPKTHAANKRLRKDIVQTVPTGGDKPLETSPELPPNKKIKLEPTSLTGPNRLNGDHYDSVGSDCEIVSVTPSPAKTKVKNRKKSTKDRTRKDDIVKEKIASIARIPKVKTTQELLAGLQSRSKDVPSVLPDHDIAKNKTEHIARFLRSQSDEPEIIDVESTNDSVTDIKPETPIEPPPPLRTVEEILARLPPLDVESIKWDETPLPSPKKESQEASEEDVERVLHEHVEGLNGNFDQSYSNSEFREWHECVSRTSHDSDLLHILPYVIID